MNYFRYKRSLQYSEVDTEDFVASIRCTNLVQKTALFSSAVEFHVNCIKFNLI